MIVDLLKLIPELGSAIAVIIVVVLFLKQQEAANLAWKAVTQEFTAALESQRKAVVDTIQQHLAAIGGMVAAMGKLEATAQHTNELIVELHRIMHERGLHHEDKPRTGHTYSDPNAH